MRPKRLEHKFLWPFLLIATGFSLTFFIPQNLVLLVGVALLVMVLWFAFRHPGGRGE